MTKFKAKVILLSFYFDLMYYCWINHDWTHFYNFTLFRFTFNSLKLQIVQKSQNEITTSRLSTDLQTVFIDQPIDSIYIWVDVKGLFHLSYFFGDLMAPIIVAAGRRKNLVVSSRPKGRTFFWLLLDFQHFEDFWWTAAITDTGKSPKKIE